MEYLDRKNFKESIIDKNKDTKTTKILSKAYEICIKCFYFDKKENYICKYIIFCN